MFSPLRSNRLTLKLIDFSDLDSIYELHSLPESDQYNTLGIPENKDQTLNHITPLIAANERPESNGFTMSIFLNSTNEFIGLFALKLWPKKNRRGEISYIIHPDHWKNGYATEALSTVLDYGFDVLKLHRIQAGCAVENIGSIKVLEKVGMVREGRGRQILPLKTGWSDNFEYSILETDVRTFIK